MATERVWPDDGTSWFDVVCPCGERFSLHWNGGELDQVDCKCGRKYYGEHRLTVVVSLEPGESRPAETTKGSVHG